MSKYLNGKLRGGGAALVLGCLLSSAVSAQIAADPPEPAPIAGHLAKAKQIDAGDPFATYLADAYYCKSPVNAQNVIRNQPKDPKPGIQLFDNAYLFGTEFVNVLVLKTSDGLIAFDSLDNPDEVKTILEPGLKQFGLDVRDIKLNIITHGHSDHYGGARYLQDTYHIPIALSEGDWNLIGWTPRSAGAVLPPKRDRVLADGEKITIGDETVTIVLTPGHTPDTASSIFTVRDHGVPRIVADWGGTAYPQNPEAVTALANSVLKFKAATKAAGVVGLLNTHAFSFNIAAIAKQNTANGPNGLILGQDRVQKALDVIEECAIAQEDWRAALGN